MIYAIDFDNTLAYGEYPNCGTPNIRLIDWLKRRKKEGHKLILWTCREGKPLLDAIEWCADKGLVFDAVNENLPEMIRKYGDSRKIGADFYIDSKALSGERVEKAIAKYKEKRKAIIF